MNLKEFLQHTKIKNRELASECLLTEGYISYIKTGKRVPSPEVEELIIMMVNYMAKEKGFDLDKVYCDRLAD